jgi:hypothetical protein
MIGIGIGLWQVTLDGQGGGNLGGPTFQNKYSFGIMNLPNPMWVVESTAAVTRDAVRSTTFVLDRT